MPWSNDDGGGNQGPWGQGNQGPRNPRNQNNWGGGGNKGGGNLPPDLDEMLRRGKDTLKNAIPGGNGRGAWLLPLALLAALVVYKSVYQVQADERGVVLRFGEYARTADPGLHFALWPVETMEKPKVGTVRQINVGSDNSEVLMLTSDKNIINVPFSVFWRISDPKAYLFNVADQERTIKAISQSAMREVAGQVTAQSILTTGKDKVAAQVMEITQSLLDQYNAGVIVSAVNLGDVQPPPEVANAFAEVVRAGQNKQQRFNEADQYRNQRVRNAEGEAAKMVEDAKGYAARVVADAQGEAARFTSVYEQYKNSKDVTRERMFLETMEDVLSNSNKVVIESGKGGPGVVPYLPLPELKPRDSGAASN